MKKIYWHLLRDVVILLCSITVAYLAVRLGWISALITRSPALALPETTIAGSLFTSVFTTAPSLVLLGEMAQHQSLLFTAGWGALGALLGDFIIFRFVRDYVTEDLTFIFHKIRRRHNLFTHPPLLRKHTFRWLIPLIGALIIASPIPDEIGLAVLGMSKMKTPTMIVITYSLNFIGIILIGLAGRALLP